MKTAHMPPSLSFAMDYQVAGLRIMGTRTIHWFHELFHGTDCISIGRTRQRDIRIHDKSISRLHCIVRKLAHGRYQLTNCQAVNGMYVSPLGRYSDYEEVQAVDLTPVMRIKLGRVKLAPITANGKSPLIAQTESMFALEAYDVYGSAGGAERHTGMKRRRLWPIVLETRKKLDERRRTSKLLEAKKKSR